MFQEQCRRGEIQLPISVDILNVAMSVEGGAGAESYVQVGVRWRSVESSAGDDGDSPLVEVRLLLSSRQGKVHLKMSYVLREHRWQWQFSQWRGDWPCWSWGTLAAVSVSQSLLGNQDYHSSQQDNINYTQVGKKTTMKHEKGTSLCLLLLSIFLERPHILKATLVGDTSGKTKSTLWENTTWVRATQTEISTQPSPLESHGFSEAKEMKNVKS